MKILVTGGAGFVGSNLVDALLAHGHSVRVLDNVSTGKRENVNPGAELVVGDICDLETVRKAMNGIEYVFHVAAIPRVPLSIERPLETHAANVDGTLNVLVAARDAKVRRVIYSASSSAYGDQPTLPLREDMREHPLNPYALQKWIGEHYCRLFSELYGLETVSLRYFNVYGPRMSSEGAYATVIGIFLRQRKAGEPLSIAGDGEQTRDFTHVDDVVRANILASESNQVGKGEVINIGAGEQHSVNEIARMIGGPTTAIPARNAEARDTLADVTRARELLGWSPAVSFSEGMNGLLAPKEQ
ncbi:hypothetical protein A3F28_02085 [Candidatus Uhrbacteria bacterium RIFCSPHIGHO2_12_FULL_57_11]|uniref:NAD-dependent epimerase/dehydratase domain-containing protein n=2 Tax=Candidatus Uhriibacteriota TaxID=1752732 RepID=A0A1F7UK79_9BACT|nr:MAG: hypothetical protein A3D72_00990 [Candidatus Uhrbacteria bacterium RIFCSPHIGHO2_02_FULL_57_19]OGL78693.1 MAG: hypothetical protein A3F28_02085 [Candidatus Uhrbacteria bacterium RIFCSPHIGHO2_12_FULL_57_11]